MNKEVYEIMDKWAKEGQIFTAYDVTKQLRNDGHYIDHHAVRNMVHNVWDANHDDADESLSSYSATNTNFGIQAIVFHPVGKDPDTYDPNWISINYQQTTTTTTTSPRSTTTTTSPRSTTTTSIITKKNYYDGSCSMNNATVTSEKRLNIPIKMIEQAGISISYCISVNNNQIIISDPNNADVNAATYPYQGRIRLSQKILSSLDKNIYDITLQNNRIYVS